MNEIDELFSRDPLELSDQDIDKIVLKLRGDLAQFAKDEAAGQRAGRSKTPIQGSPDDILKELGL